MSSRAAKHAGTPVVLPVANRAFAHCRGTTETGYQGHFGTIPVRPRRTRPWLIKGKFFTSSAAVSGEFYEEANRGRSASHYLQVKAALWSRCSIFTALFRFFGGVSQSEKKQELLVPLSDFSEGGSKVVVVENQNGRKCLDCCWMAQRVKPRRRDGPAVPCRYPKNFSESQERNSFAAATPMSAT
jgi:hypothetical protein